MPNWCSNHMTVSGPVQDLSRFHNDLVRAKGKLASMVMPVPADLLDTLAGGYGADENGNRVPEQVLLDEKREKNVKTHGYADWYDWCVAHWGTKWDADGLDLVDGDPIGDYNYGTAWAPFGNGLMEALSSKYPGLLFEVRYDEPGCGFAGIVASRDGEIVLDRYGEMVGDSFVSNGEKLFTLPETSGDEDDSDWTDRWDEYAERLDVVLAAWHGQLDAIAPR